MNRRRRKREWRRREGEGSKGGMMEERESKRRGERGGRGEGEGRARGERGEERGLSLPSSRILNGHFLGFGKKIDFYHGALPTIRVDSLSSWTFTSDPENFYLI
jgi:hypothetical protein